VTRAAIAVAGGLMAMFVAPAAADQRLVTVYGDRGVHRHPDASSRVVTALASTRPITSARTTLPVLDRTTAGPGPAWLRVRLPGRALGQLSVPRSGWIRSTHTLRSTTPWHLVIDRGRRRVDVFERGRRVHRYSAIVGAPSTPTPAGEYFVEENVRLAWGLAGAPFALATSARSAVFQEFEGGPGQIALHGRGGVGGVLGTAASHGCIRLGTGAITWLAARLGPGVPVTIR
jgi:hypothetical protein